MMDWTSVFHLTPAQILVIWAAIAVFTLVANQMPEPTPTSSVAYRWLYGVLHTAGANLGRVLSALRPKLLGGGNNKPQDPPRG